MICAAIVITTWCVAIIIMFLLTAFNTNEEYSPVKHWLFYFLMIIAALVNTYLIGTYTT